MEEHRALLRDFSNVEEAGTRFPESQGFDGLPILCPKCQEPALEDRWPPNYHGSSYTISSDGTTFHGEAHGSWKCVCVSCRIAFRFWYQGDRNKPETGYSDTEPLVEYEGKWLTPHDVWRQAYYQEYGEWPLEAYG
jgi:hypothetical protein